MAKITMKSNCYSHNQGYIVKFTWGFKSQHGGDKVPTFEPQETIEVCFTSFLVRSWLFYVKCFLGFVLQGGSSLLYEPTLNASPGHHLQQLLSCRYPCHTWGLGFGIPCEVINPNFHALNDWEFKDWPQINWDLELATPCEPTLNSRTCMRHKLITLFTF